jgi:ATP-dependent DNA helicase RecQ
MSSNELINFKEKCNSIIRHKFNYKSIKDTQFDIIANVYVYNKDVLGVLATGAGKSLCYQIFYYLYNSPIFVVSPLVALIYDQINTLKQKNIYAIYASNNSTSNDKLLYILSHVSNIIIYITPEWIVNNIHFFENIINKYSIELVAIDECHCISTWGHDFRDDYLKLEVLKQLFPNIKLMALTATATVGVKYEIINCLKLNDPVIVQTTFDRPNIDISIAQKKDTFIETLDFLKDRLSQVYSIIYCQTRKETEEIALLIKTSFNIPVDMYHAGMHIEHRRIIQDKFCSGKIKIIVSTVAFGMGIDQDVNIVVHWGIPKSIESYYQEIGRCGRDGTQSFAYLFYSKQDICKGNFFIRLEKNEYLKEKKKELWATVKNFVLGKYCRRKYILNYFDEEYFSNNCKSCDYCTGVRSELDDYTNELVDLIKVMGENNNLIILRFLINSMKEYYQRENDWWYEFLHMLRDNEMVQFKRFPFNHNEYVCLTMKTFNWHKKYKLQKSNIILLPHVAGGDIKVPPYLFVNTE